MLSHEILMNELRKLRNDLLFLKANVFYPKDIDHGPTEEMISVDGITIPDYVKVLKVPDAALTVSPEYQRYSVAMSDIDLFLDSIESMDLRMKQFIVDFNKYIEPNTSKALVRGQILFGRIIELIPKNFNYHLRKFFAYMKQLQVNYTIISRVNEYLSAFDFIESGDLCPCLTNSKITSVDEWIADMDVLLEDGMFTVTSEESINSLRDSMAILMKEQTFLYQLGRSVTAYGKNHTDFLNEVSNAINTSTKIDTTDWHLERSKVPLIEFDKKLPTVDSYTPELPHKYVHGEYLCDSNKYKLYTPTVEDPMHITTPISVVRPAMVGDEFELP